MEGLVLVLLLIQICCCYSLVAFEILVEEAMVLGLHENQLDLEYLYHPDLTWAIFLESLVELS